MNNEPVAYRWKSNLGYIYDIYDFGNGEPLYTHPAKTLTITFEDCIAASFEQDVGYGGDLDLFEFAKAILRKAQEK